MMTPPQTEILETVAVKRCHTCQAELLIRDTFCRRCGVRQTNGYATSSDLTSSPGCQGRALTGSAGGYPLYSGQLIRIVSESLSARTAAQRPGRGLRQLVCTLITIPIWMMIVMLSPLDAYTAAKAAVKSMG